MALEFSQKSQQQTCWRAQSQTPNSQKSTRTKLKIQRLKGETSPRSKSLSTPLKKSQLMKLQRYLSSCSSTSNKAEMRHSQMTLLRSCTFLHPSQTLSIKKFACCRVAKRVKCQSTSGMLSQQLSYQMKKVIMRAVFVIGRATTVKMMAQMMFKMTRLAMLKIMTCLGKLKNRSKFQRCSNFKRRRPRLLNTTRKSMQ